MYALARRELSCSWEHTLSINFCRADEVRKIWGEPSYKLGSESLCATRYQMLDATGYPRGKNDVKCQERVQRLDETKHKTRLHVHQKKGGANERHNKDRLICDSEMGKRVLL